LLVIRSPQGIKVKTKPKKEKQMKLQPITSVAFALAAAAILGTSAHAQNASFSSGDLLLGFEQSGSASDYLVDLGAVTQFSNPSSAPLTFDLSTADLSTVFGASWASNSEANLVQWGVIGGSAQHGNLTVNGKTFSANTLFYTIGETTPGTQSAPPAEFSSATQQPVNANIGNLDTGSGGFKNSTITGNGSYQAVIQTSSATNSYAYEITTQGNFGSGVNIQQPTSSGTGPTDSVLDLYELNPVNGGTGTYLGDFSLNSGGVLTFTSVAAAAVPEPSSVLLLGIGVLVLLGGLRRKGSSQL
jgi:PEP-CTERM motif